MSELYHKEDEPQLICWDRINYNSVEAQLAALEKSRTVYVGNLSFFTQEQQIYETFSTIGPVKRFIMGLNQYTKTPCGFCFIEYYTQEHYHAALKFLNETVCDDRIIRCDADAGYLPGRQFGRGKSGGQFRDERRTDFDPARGRFIPPEILATTSGKRSRNDDDDYDGDEHERYDKYGRNERNGRDGRNHRNSYPMHHRNQSDRSYGHRQVQLDRNYRRGEQQSQQYGHDQQRPHRQPEREVQILTVHDSLPSTR